MTIFMHTDKYRDTTGTNTKIPIFGWMPDSSGNRYPKAYKAAYDGVIIPRSHPDNTSPFDNHVA